MYNMLHYKSTANKFGNRDKMSYICNCKIFISSVNFLKFLAQCLHYVNSTQGVNPDKNPSSVKAETCGSSYPQVWAEVKSPNNKNAQIVSHT